MKRDKRVIIYASLILALGIGVFANLLFAWVGWWSMLVYAIGGTALLNKVYQETDAVSISIDQPVLIVEDEDPLGVEAGLISVKTNPTKH